MDSVEMLPKSKIRIPLMLILSSAYILEIRKLGWHEAEVVAALVGPRVVLREMAPKSVSSNTALGSGFDRRQVVPRRLV
jgi:hypothetical protein